MSKQFERTSERTSKWPSTQICILDYSGPQWSCKLEQTALFRTVDFTLAMSAITMKITISSLETAIWKRLAVSNLEGEIATVRIIKAEASDLEYTLAVSVQTAEFSIGEKSRFFLRC